MLLASTLVDHSTNGFTSPSREWRLHLVAPQKLRSALRIATDTGEALGRSFGDSGCPYRKGRQGLYKTMPIMLRTKPY
jgi:hypothetical protein